MMMPFGIEGDNHVNVILTVDEVEEKFSGAWVLYNHKDIDN